MERITNTDTPQQQRCRELLNKLGYPGRMTYYEVLETYHPYDWGGSGTSYYTYSVTLYIFDIFKFGIRGARFNEPPPMDTLYGLVADKLDTKIAALIKKYKGAITFEQYKEQDLSAIDNNTLRPAKRKVKN